MNLQSYLDRVGFDGTPCADLEGLNALIRTHVTAVPFENLDVQLGTPLTTDIEAAYDKIVVRRRGGWCYEMNGLFGWVLGEIGFDVRRLSAGVMRDQRGDEVLGNHLCLLVECEGAHLIDVGFGGSLTSSLPIMHGTAEHLPYRISLEQVDGEYWRFTETINADPFSFDFTTAAANEDLLSGICQDLQTSPGSPFVRNLVVQTRRADSHISLRGRLLKHAHQSGDKKKLLGSASELIETLNVTFGLDVPKAADLWPQIRVRHEELFANVK